MSIGYTIWRPPVYRAEARLYFKPSTDSPLAALANLPIVGTSGNDDLNAAFERVADELHTQYLLAFAPPRRDGKVHKIDVKVDAAGTKPRARRSYVAPKDQQNR